MFYYSYDTFGSKLIPLDVEVGRIFIDTSPFSNQNYFETKERTL